MAKRDRRHFVPAALIGHFAGEPNLANLRRSKVAVKRFAPPTNFESAAENIGFSRTLYRGTIPVMGVAFCQSR